MRQQLPKLQFNLKDPGNFGNLAEKLSVEERRRLADDLIEFDERMVRESTGVPRKRTGFQRQRRAAEP